jgi:hypothetical protein
MKSFLIKVSCFLLLGIALFLCVRILQYYRHIRKYDTKNFNSAFINKLKILKRYKETRKIVLIGGSSVGFGLAAEQVEKATGIKTINLGHHAGFGLVDFKNFILENLNRDDIIIFSPEWHFFNYPATCDEPTLDNLINNNIEYGKLLHQPVYVLRALTLFPSSYAKQYKPYIYNCLDLNGDIDTHCGLPQNELLNYEIPTEKFDYTTFIKHFAFLEDHRTILLFPPTQARVYEKHKTTLHEIEATLRQHDIMIADSVRYNVYPEADFYDATYHLNCEARTRRTDSLIVAIQKLMITRH